MVLFGNIMQALHFPSIWRLPFHYVSGPRQPAEKTTVVLLFSFELSRLMSPVFKDKEMGVYFTTHLHKICAPLELAGMVFLTR